MNIIILGAAGFIGTNLVIKLAENKENNIVLVDTKKEYFQTLNAIISGNVRVIVDPLVCTSNFDELLKGMDIVYHLVSTTSPTTSNEHISEELEANVMMSAKMFESAIRCDVKRVIFISSGGTVYGIEPICPIKETSATYPINSYGIQKITIEKLLYLYNYLYGLDYRIVRLSNPYGPFQRPNGKLGVVTTFIYKALRGEDIVVYGDGSVIRDFIFIDDAVRGILNIAGENVQHRVYNIGSGNGTSIKQLIEELRSTLELEMVVKYTPKRIADVPVNYLDISRYESCYGKLESVSLKEGIRLTADFMRRYNIV